MYGLFIDIVSDTLMGLVLGLVSDSNTPEQKHTTFVGMFCININKYFNRLHDGVTESHTFRNAL